MFLIRYIAMKFQLNYLRSCKTSLHETKRNKSQLNLKTLEFKVVK